MNRAGFNMIELVFVIVILGILSAVAVPKLVMSRDDACIANLRTTLAETQSILTKEYTSRFMRGVKFQNNEVTEYLKTLTTSANDGCKFELTGQFNGQDGQQLIRATVGRNTLNFQISLGKNQTTINPQNTTKTPMIVCDLKQDLCQRITGKKTTN